MMRALLIAASIFVLGLAARAASAQPTTTEAGGPEPSSAQPGVEGARGEHAGAEHAEHHDPSEHFNFFNFSWSGKDVLGGPLGDGVNRNPETGETIRGEEEEAMSPPFVFMLLNFALLLGLLSWKGKPIVQKLAADRHDQIKTALEEAAKLRKQAADKLAEYDDKLKQADAEIKKMVEGMRIDAEADKKRILAAAEAQAVQMKRDAEVRIAAEIEFARAQLTREVTIAATSATEKLLREKMTSNDQQKLIGTFIAGVEGAPQKEAR
jgi:F-type H+-transporting ATPase subunit b